MQGRLPVEGVTGQKFHQILRFFLTLFTIQHLSKMLVASGFGQHPWPVRHRRLVTHVLSMAAGQVGHPIAMLVLVIGNDRLVHDACGDDGIARLS
jgi:hypothetical protein